ncbi:MAG: hypothetical protein KC481_10070 [Acidimicrobiaceae bacterium]|nr:hypothetical protein [Acidimicrobiaceae bacterium]MCH9802937.1 hypothetical protein [bacterium]MDB4103275.1 hypothetical protein [Acidimicrobiales bacterium]MCO4833994.1 hypothetical protein [Acidimicrobiaceae bacterium]MDC0350018.1 hypothetical protein [bacterium]
MPVQSFGDRPRTITMVCGSCDVTWRGNGDDACWSCGDSAMVGEATPRQVRYSPAVVNAERLVG